MARKKKNALPAGKLKVMMLGGLNEIGKNIGVLEYENDIIVVDCGLGFPDDDMLGIDLVIPDVTYLEKNKEKIRGIFITHGHEDHIGALPYVLKTLTDIPVYGTRLTLGILENKLMEHRYERTPILQTVAAGDVVPAGVFDVEFIHVNHSIADACCLAIRTPLGTVVHTGDFKLDISPIDGEMMDITRLGQLGKEGVLLLMCESTNAERPGFTPSEKTVGASLDSIFMRNQDKRIVIATFSSNVHRVQQIINTSVAYNRKVAVTGRSMINIISAAIDLGYMNVPKGALIDINEIKKYPMEQITIVTTGSQGEPMSALYRMAFADHDKVQIGPKDLVVISAHAIPGNEKLVDKIINELFKSGATVFRDSVIDVHVSGHACQEELKLMQALTKPKYFMPIHGEYKHLIMNKELAQYMGTPESNIFVPDIGKAFVTDRPRRGVREAALSYLLLETAQTVYGTLSLLLIRLGTGRFHQIRVQFASRRHPLAGDGKYGARDSLRHPALWACRLVFPYQGRARSFSAPPPEEEPWSCFPREIMDRLFSASLPEDREGDLFSLLPDPGVSGG